MIKVLKKHEDKEQGRTKHEAPRSINHKTPQNTESTYATVHGPVPALQHHLSKMHPFMLQQLDPTAITVTDKNIPSTKCNR